MCSSDLGEVWDSMPKKLNQIDSPQFRIKDNAKEELKSAGYYFNGNSGQRSERRRQLVVPSLKI